MSEFLDTVAFVGIDWCTRMVSKELRSATEVSLNSN